MSKKDLYAGMACAPVRKPETTGFSEDSKAQGSERNMGEQEAEYSGELNIKIPKSLHRQLDERAKSEGVSLFQYIIYKLAK